MKTVKSSFKMQGAGLMFAAPVELEIKPSSEKGIRFHIWVSLRQQRNHRPGSTSAVQQCLKRFFFQLFQNWRVVFLAQFINTRVSALILTRCLVKFFDRQRLILFVGHGMYLLTHLLIFLSRPHSRVNVAGFYKVIVSHS